ncbi:lipoyl synthase [bacterium (Candidatus Blackallbacteria) CG17_big_fil_post_rev_8_21_14_2_50_48_46]|uniref:Lipoyl synthase n=1 Tax=bacterium (Candidatus Blackallbacteria) CG17_big_fil_post_rev_8_21_14_2_50_48_46 TaxID=2014261 RepID=A0A2M7FZJ5_9BACT|nr:MAG: lipoyl synthase [bacterium (Candidatus Blackallbacteria) CG18_big_fil_WC_8_21_14_2_50_49_26]PIW14293.1 MAG: lipoyl synthase [bacterium (Candidatus Blackallbacteria) CG17_big_fil_post_rev_8_21_14_2_50_48_46]PIW45562.1 MAG: lipoyl synthase [bacterium (Candidatus Blackallbacteria) CG13_big_fil_rev_8_21_14_2_50_49_14]
MLTDRPLSRQPKPPWLKVRLAGGENYAHLKQILRERELNTVCEEARCPNIGECWGGGTATFMLMGDTCTRGCRFCAVKTAKRGQPLDADEPQKVAEAIAAMDLDYVVLTSVDRDDLPDGGAGHFAQTVEAIRLAHPRILIEVLIPDFQEDPAALDRLIAAKPDVIAHNLETVARLSKQVRDAKASYQGSLNVLAYIKQKDPSRYTKSALMLGLGETDAEVEQALNDLRAYQTDILTIGQYLQPTSKHLPVLDFIPPEKFAEWQKICEDKGFLYTASGPLVRSSYRAGELFVKNLLLKEKNDD